MLAHMLPFKINPLILLLLAITGPRRFAVSYGGSCVWVKWRSGTCAAHGVKEGPNQGHPHRRERFYRARRQAWRDASGRWAGIARAAQQGV